MNYLPSSIDWNMIALLKLELVSPRLYVLKLTIGY
jgi:hypothetical protein